MALRSLNSVGPERKKAMMRKSRLANSNVPGANDENVDLLGTPNPLPPPPRSNGSSAAATAPASCSNSSSSSSINNGSSKLPSSETVASPSALPSQPPSEDASAEIEYILSENLPDLDDVEFHLTTLLERLDSKEWMKVCEAINTMRQLSIYHSSSLLVLLEKAVPLIVKSLKNPRSALCKTAIMASADLFTAYPKTILSMLEQLLLQLLLKASQDKKFVCEEAEKSLEVMTDKLSPASLLAQLQPYVKHRSPRVRAKAASCAYRLVSKLGPEGIREYGFEPLLQMAASQLNDQLPEARESARKLIADVYAAYPCVIPSEEGSSPDTVPDQQDWQQFCSAQLSTHVAQAILRLTSGA